MEPDRHDFAATQRHLEEILRAALRLVRAELTGDAENVSFKELDALLARLDNKLRQGTFQVAVLALAKSGKSTLINAFLGEEYLPSANTPETARIVTIRCTPGTAVLEAGPLRTEGVGQINARLRALNKGIREGTPTDAHNLVLKAPLSWVDETDLASHQFEILDTPGPNEAGATELHRQVLQVLEEADAIIYILDYTKLKTVEEATLLGLLKDLRPELLRNYSERLFFVLNKIDLADRNSSSLEETIDYVQALLAQTFGGLTVQKNRIIPISASHALLSRLVRTDDPSERVRADFIKEAFGKRRKSTATLDQCREVAADFLDESNVPHLEREVLQFVFMNRGRLLHQSVAVDLQRYITRLVNHYTVAQATLKVDHSELEERLVQLKDELAHVSEGLQGIVGEGERAKRDVETWVRSRFHGFAEEAKLIIDDMLGDATPKSRPGFFRTVWETVRDLVTGEVVDPNDLTKNIDAVNHRINELLQVYYAQFQSQLVQEAHEKQKVVFAKIAEIIAPLVRTVEQKVNQTLAISLTPIDINMPGASLREFQADVRRNTARFITSKSRVEQKTQMKTQRVRGNGWCAPVRIVKVETSSLESVTRHRISPPELKAFWQELIQGMTEDSVATVSGMLDHVFETIAARAQKELRTYASSFVQIIEQEIKESEIHRDRRALRLQGVKSRKGASVALLAAIQRQTALLVDLPVREKPAQSPPLKPAVTLRSAPVDVAIITVLPEEFGAVWALLDNCKPEYSPDLVNVHAEHVGEIQSPNHGKPYRVVLAMSGVPGNVPTATTVGSVVRRFSPRYVILCGIAGGLGEKRQRGDLVVARAVTLYEYGKLTETFVPRPEFTHLADEALLKAAEALKAKRLLSALDAIARPGGLEGTVQIDYGPVLSGDKVVDDVGNTLFREVLRVWPNAAAVEMEGAGAGWAIHSLRSEGVSVGFLMVRGISDVPKGNSATPGSAQSGTLARDEAKRYAASLAAAFVIKLVQHAWPVSPKDA